ncbi:MAG: M6 family metalloprotease domain-containing protein [Candidatus Zixiibacteriota bacterium]|nr:MAG: M6 family metalloprotease domain-containing protein [candidate division Zixibacteria bacterium]
MKTKLFAVFLAILIINSALGVSISPEIVRLLKANGQLGEIVLQDKIARERGVWEANPDPYRFGVTDDVDTLNCLIILVDFDDMPHENGLNTVPEDFDTLLFSWDYTPFGSMTDYYFETSYGQVYLTGQVTQWYRMPELYAYYVDGQRGFGDYPRNAQRLTEDAVLTADPDVDFSMYDNDGDLQVDALFVIHAGPGYESTGNFNHVHSHAYFTSYPVPVDGVTVYHYSMEPEEAGLNQLVTIGVFCHELGHVLGLPDLYDYDYDSDGCGMWSMMSRGSWGGGGARPVHFDAWSKTALGWVTPYVVQARMDQEQIDAVEHDPDIYQLFALGIPTYEYFLVENRRWIGFDMSLPGEGLLIYHVDETVPNNSNQNHYKVAVEQADGEFHLENNSGSDAGDPWPGTSDNRTFDDFSVPDAWYYFLGPSEVSVANISDSDSSMFADLTIEYNLPLYELLDVLFNDNVGNNNGYPDPGETVDLVFSARNVRAQVDDLVVTASCSENGITFIDSIINMGSQPLHTPFGNDADPFVFTVDSNFPVSFIELTLTFAAVGGDYQQQFQHSVLVGHPDILLVDDDGGLDEHTYYTDAMETLELPYHIWDISAQGSPRSILNQYLITIWFTGDTRLEPMSAQDVSGLINYLNFGARLLITSQDFVQRLSERGEANDIILLNDYLKVDYQGPESYHMTLGVAGTPFDGLQVLTAGNGGAGNQYSMDALTIFPGGQEMLEYGSGNTAGVGVSGNYAAITIGFGIEGIYNGYPGYNTREDIIDAALSFLWGATGTDDVKIAIPEDFALAQNYPNPFNASTNISFSLPQAGDLKIVIYDLLGRVVDIPLNEFKEAGGHTISWDGDKFTSGIYFYRLETAEGSYTRRMTLLK